MNELGINPQAVATVLGALPEAILRPLAQLLHGLAQTAGLRYAPIKSGGDAASIVDYVNDTGPDRSAPPGGWLSDGEIKNIGQRMTEAIALERWLDGVMFAVQLAGLAGAGPGGSAGGNVLGAILGGSTASPGPAGCGLSAAIQQILGGVLTGTKQS